MKMTKAQIRTQNFLNKLRGSSNEYSKIQGALLLLIGIGQDALEPGYRKAAAQFDANMLAQRMDEMNAEVLVKYRSESEAI